MSIVSEILQGQFVIMLVVSQEPTVIPSDGGTAVTGQTAPTFTLPNLGANTYSVVFTDAITSCTATTSVIISQPSSALALNLRVEQKC